MKDSYYDIIIIGSGPIGVSTAYFLKDSGKKILVITKDPSEDRSSTYLYAGGSIRWYFSGDEQKETMTKMTADFIKNTIAPSTDVFLIEDQYLFLNKKGIAVPSINVSGRKVIQWLLQSVKDRGISFQEKTTVMNIEKKEDAYIILTDKGEFFGKKVLLAVGASLPQLFKTNMKFEKRQLFVLDLPVDEYRAKLPHTILPLRDKLIHFFIKKFDSGFRVVVGQEGLIKHTNDSGPEDYFKELLDAGLAEKAPFLKDAHVEKILWGFDAENKILNLEEKDGLFVATCGSAIRSCVWIGKTIAEKILK